MYLSDAILMVLMVKTGVLCFGEEDSRSKMPFSSFHIKGTYCQHVLHCDVKHGYLTEAVFVRFSIPQGLLGNLLSTLNSLEGSHNAYPTLKEQGVTLHLQRRDVST